MKAMITGHLGFVGPHLEDYLHELEIDTVGFDLRRGDDIRDYEQVRTFLDMHQPDLIFHLAALSFVGESRDDPQRAVDTHVTGTLNILDAVRKLGLHPKIHLASTSEEYGYGDQTGDVTELSPTRPANVYGATKAAMTKLALAYVKQFGMRIVVTRAFNHIGTGKGEQFADSSFAKRIVQIERDEAIVLKHGNLESIRNFTDVRDIVKAYAGVIHAQPGVYNVCSDNNLTMQTLLDKLVEQAGSVIDTEVDERLYRPESTIFHTPSYASLHKATGWRPLIPIEQSAKDVLNDWRERLI